jgi:hypothetical protein
MQRRGNLYFDGRRQRWYCRWMHEGKRQTKAVGNGYAIPKPKAGTEGSGRDHARDGHRKGRDVRGVGACTGSRRCRGGIQQLGDTKPG